MVGVDWFLPFTHGRKRVGQQVRRSVEVASNDSVDCVVHGRVDGYLHDEEGIIQTDGLRDAIDDWLSLLYGALERCRLDWRGASKSARPLSNALSVQSSAFRLNSRRCCSTSCVKGFEPHSCMVTVRRNVYCGQSNLLVVAYDSDGVVVDREREGDDIIVGDQQRQRVVGAHFSKGITTDGSMRLERAGGEYPLERVLVIEARDALQGARGRHVRYRPARGGGPFETIDNEIDDAVWVVGVGDGDRRFGEQVCVREQLGMGDTLEQWFEVLDYVDSAEKPLAHRDESGPLGGRPIATVNVRE